MILAVILFGHGSLNPVNHVGAVCVESAYGCGKTSLAILGSYLEGGVFLWIQIDVALLHHITYI